MTGRKLLWGSFRQSPFAYLEKSHRVMRPAKKRQIAAPPPEAPEVAASSASRHTSGRKSAVESGPGTSRGQAYREG